MPPVNFSVGLVRTGSLIFEKKLETFTSRSSSGRTYWLTARVSSVIRSSKWVFTSVPMPKQKTRVWPWLAFFTSAMICSSSVVPMVGRPSVRKITTKGRSLPPGRNASASCRASSMAVPPMGFRARMNSSALARFCSVALTSLSNSGSTSVEKRMISNRSPSLRFSTQNCKAFLACARFLPGIEPGGSPKKGVAVVEVLDAELQGLLGLRQFLAGHRAGGVQHEGNVLHGDLLLLNIHAR